MKKINVLSLSLFNDIWPHSYPEYKLLNSIDQNQISIDYLTCERNFSYCNVMESRNVKVYAKIGRKKACNSCIKIKDFYANNSKLHQIKIQNYIDEKDFIEIKKIIKKTNKKNFLSLKVFGIDVGKYTLFNFLIREKVSDLNFDNRLFNIYLVDLENCLIALFAVKKVIEKKKYEYLIAYSLE